MKKKIAEKSSENESYTFELILSCSYFSISKLILFSNPTSFW